MTNLNDIVLTDVLIVVGVVAPQLLDNYSNDKNVDWRQAIVSVLAA